MEDVIAMDGDVVTVVYGVGKVSPVSAIESVVSAWWRG
jgi:hypothetical protein